MDIKEFQKMLKMYLIKSDSISIQLMDVVFILSLLIGVSISLKIINRYILKTLVDKSRLDDGSINSIYQLIKYVVWVITLIIVLETIGVKLTILIAGSAALLVGLGLGIQQIFNDVVSGIILLMERNMTIGDVVELDNGIVGRVEQIGLRTSLIKTRDDINMIIPNSKFVSDRIINWSHSDDNTRFSVDIGVAYGSDVPLVHKVLLEVLDGHHEISENPAPMVLFSGFGDSSLNFKLMFWSSSNFRIEIVKSDLRYKIDHTFRKNNITIPFPQRDVHLKKQ